MSAARRARCRGLRCATRAGARPTPSARRSLRLAAFAAWPPSARALGGTGRRPAGGPDGRSWWSSPRGLGGGARPRWARRAAAARAPRAPRWRWCCWAARSRWLRRACPLRLLPPGAWDELGAELDRGLSGIRTVEWPYAGDEAWVRLVILLGAPLVLAGRRGAGLLARPPRGRGLLRALGARRAARALRHRGHRARPRLAAAARPRAVPAGGGLAVAAAAARARGAAGRGAACWRWACSRCPLAARLDADAAVDRLPLVELVRRQGRDLRLEPHLRAARLAAGGHHAAPGRSPTSPLYWKAEALDHFDGLRWVRSAANERTGPRGRAARPDPTPRWDEQHPRDRALAAHRLRGRRRHAVPGDGRRRGRERLGRRHRAQARRAARAGRHATRSRLRARSVAAGDARRAGELRASTASSTRRIELPAAGRDRAAPRPRPSAGRGRRARERDGAARGRPTARDGAADRALASLRYARHLPRWPGA